MKINQCIAAIALAVLLAACTPTLNGIYKDELGLQKYEFTQDGKVYVSTMGITKESTYRLEDKKVKINDGESTIIYDMNEDGSIKGPLGMTLKLVAK